MHFPTGGVGMNIGIQDAHNLDWKLAAGLTGRADEALLDTYHKERRPVGVNLLEHTRAQTALMTAYSPERQALRALLSGRIATARDMSRELAERLPGSAHATGKTRPEPSTAGRRNPVRAAAHRRACQDRSSTCTTGRTPRITINPLSPRRLSPPPDHSDCGSIRFVQSVRVGSRD
jgi:hypothetical protein